MAGLSCKTLAVKEVDGNVIFLHKIVNGISDRSFGIHVADLAGMVPSVTKRARELLQVLLQNSKHGSLILKQTTEFDKITELKKMLTPVNVNNLSGKEALNILQQIQHIVAS